MNTLKLEVEQEACGVCGLSGEELFSPEEHDATAAPGALPLRAMLLHLNNNKVIPPGRLCTGCIRRTVDAYNFSTALASKGPPPLSEKIRALRKRLHELTQKIDVFIVVGSGGGAEGAYNEEDIIMVERSALAIAARADANDLGLQPPYQCSVCPLTFQRMSEYRSHCARHPPASAHWCWSCGAQCASAAAARAHALQHAPSTTLICHLCTSTFQSGAEQRRHEASCPARCPVCSALLPSHAALRTHAARHPALCSVCLLHCADAEECAAHALHHARDKHFVCGYKACILRFHTRSNLLAHIRKCHGDTPEEREPRAAPAVCPHCARTFGSAAAMKRHARSHLRNTAEDLQMSQDPEWTEAGGARVEYLEMDTLEDGL